MGLSSRDTSIEEASLGLHATHDTDEMVTKYFESKPIHRPRYNLDKLDEWHVLDVSTYGFKNGILQHNMPCPICLVEFALYTANDDGGYFGPCKKCKLKGYAIVNKDIEGAG